MKKYLISLLLLLAPMLAVLPAAAGNPPSFSTIASGSPVRVYYSFDHYANNPKMQRSFISEDMLKAAAKTNALKSSAWDVSDVASRLTSLLSLHTHSRSTTKLVRKDLEKVSALTDYERLMHTKQNNVELVVFCHRTRGKNISELLIFRFRDDYCSRVFQLTGKLSTNDIATIIQMHKKK